MKTITASAAQAWKISRNDFREIFRSTQMKWQSAGFSCRITIECIGRSDARYHNYEHTWLVIMVGRDILQG